MDQNKTSKYFKYTIGEIVLVVIGILIALQINNWNENRNADKAEQRLIIGLNEEFKLNRSALEVEIKRIDSTISGLSATLKQMNGTSSKTYSGKALDSLLLVCIANYLWEATDFALKEIENSNSLSNLKNKNLKPLIYDWSRLNKQIEQRTSNSIGAFDYLLNFIKVHGSLRQLDVYGEDLPEGPSNLRPDNFHLLSNPEFENALDDYLVYTRQLQRSYKAALTQLDVIIEATAMEEK